MKHFKLVNKTGYLGHLPDFDHIYHEAIEDLGIKADSIKENRKIIISNKGNSSTKEGIFINPNNRNGEPLNLWELDFLFKHELIHTLTHDNICYTPVLFWEGLPIYFADNKYREKHLGFNYHQTCSLFLASNTLYRIEDLLMADYFYRFRSDPRVDHQAGSFVGFLIETYGVEKLKSVLTKIKMPSVKEPILYICEALKKSFSKGLKELETDWISFLTKSTITNKLIKDWATTIPFLKEAPPEKYHCKFCFTPQKAQFDVCSFCNANQKINITIK